MSRIKVFTGPGALDRLHGKKPVLSNKSLTRRVRALTGLEGERITTAFQNIFNDVTLTANTSEIVYFAGLNGLTNTLIHKVRFWINVVGAASDSTVRILIIEDTQLQATNLVEGDILETSDPFASYSQGGADIHPFSAKRLNKNLPLISRARVLKDMMFSQVNGTLTDIKALKFDINYRGRKADNNTGWLVLVISSDANVIDMNILADVTNLDD